MERWKGRLCLITALSVEAKPLIEHYKLSSINNRYFRIYEGNNIILIISGVGKIKSSIATTYILSQIDNLDRCVALNIGLCGTQDRSHNRGTPILVNKVRDRDTGYEYFPDILFSHNMIEGGVETHSVLVSLENQPPIEEKFVDMEASGFFEGASTFLPPHRISCIKVVSDYLDGYIPDKTDVIHMIGEVIPAIDCIYRVMEYHMEHSTVVLDDREKTYLDRIAEHIRLTVSQTHELYDMAFKYKLRTGEDIPSFEDIFAIEVKTKEEGKREFERIKRIFWSK